MITYKNDPTFNEFSILISSSGTWCVCNSYANTNSNQGITSLQRQHHRGDGEALRCPSLSLRLKQTSLKCPHDRAVGFPHTVFVLFQSEFSSAVY